MTAIPARWVPVDVFWQTGKPLAEVWLPEQGIPPYRGRG
jgi:7-cyano-7-deazaguanine reductase